MTDRAATNRLIPTFASQVVPSSGTIGLDPVWVPVFRATSDKAETITLIINCELVPFNPLANFSFQSDLRVRWRDDKGNGEALLDATSGIVLTVVGSFVEVECSHKSVIALANLPGPDLNVSVSGVFGSQAHPRPVRSQRLDVAAGGITPRVWVPRYTYLTRIEAVPEVTGQLILRGYQAQAAASPIIQEVSGRNPLVMAAGVDWISVENTSITNRSVLVIHELVL